MMREHTPDPVDVHVGDRIRQRRKMLGQSQEALAKALGVTFQQVQKYERGANRISASMMYRAAKAQGVPPAYYFEGLELAATADEPPEIVVAAGWLQSSEAVPVAQAIVRLPPQLRRVMPRIAAALEDA